MWHIKKLNLTKDVTAPKDGRMILVKKGNYTQLWRWTLATIKRRLEPPFDDILPDPGELVMTDSDDELNTHLGFMLRAHGRVLITGLGLGCVIRGCLANPAVQHVVCIERDPDVIKMVKPYMPAERLTIIQADALSWTRNNLGRQKFDSCWHDLWSDPDKHEPNLALIHSELFVICHPHVGVQGAWAFPKVQKRLWKQKVGKIIT